MTDIKSKARTPGGHYCFGCEESRRTGNLGSRDAAMVTIQLNDVSESAKPTDAASRPGLALIPGPNPIHTADKG